MTDLKMTTSNGTRVVRASGGPAEAMLAIDAPGRTESVATLLTPAEAHEIADWIKANVPEPERTPLPTKFAAVVKTTDGKLYTRADASGEGYEYDWVRADSNGGDWETDSYLIAAGFEVIFEGVDV